MKDSEVRELAIQVDELPDDDFYYFIDVLAGQRGFNIGIDYDREGFIDWLRQVLDEISAPTKKE